MALSFRGSWGGAGRAPLNRKCSARAVSACKRVSATVLGECGDVVACVIRASFCFSALGYGPFVCLRVTYVNVKDI